MSFRFTKWLQWVVKTLYKLSIIRCTGCDDASPDDAAAAVANAASQYEYAIFFDNEPKRIDEVEQYCKNIQCVKINETAERLLMTKFTDPIYTEFLARNDITKETNQYYNYISRAVYKDALDLLSGINPENVDTLNSWIEETNGKRAAIFDWDRTLTVFEVVLVTLLLLDILKFRILFLLPNIKTIN